MLTDSARWISESVTAAAGLGLAAGGFLYAAMVPSSQIFGTALIAPKIQRHIALTFDDGPNPAWTPQLLEILARHHVKATFFLLGKYVEQEPYLARYIAQSGHMIGNHTWSHPNLAFSSWQRGRSELVRTNHLLEQITGTKVRFFRPPFGARRPGVMNFARDLGMIPALWNVMTDDWRERSPERIAERLSAKIDSTSRRGFAANIVLHDGGHLEQGAHRGPSVDAVRLLLERYVGVRRFVTLDAWV